MGTHNILLNRTREASKNYQMFLKILCYRHMVYSGMHHILFYLINMFLFSSFDFKYKHSICDSCFEPKKNAPYGTLLLFTESRRSNLCLDVRYS